MLMANERSGGPMLVAGDTQRTTVVRSATPAPSGRLEAGVLAVMAAMTR